MIAVIVFFLFAVSKVYFSSQTFVIPDPNQTIVRGFFLFSGSNMFRLVTVELI